MAKKAFLFLTVLILVLLLAACGSSNNNSSTTTNNNSTVSNEVKQEPKKEVTLKWPLHWAGVDPVSETIKAVVEEFNAANKGDVQVELVGIPEYTNYLNNVKTNFAANQAVDLFFVQESITSPDFWGSGKLADLSTFIDDEFKTYKTETMWSELTTSDGQILGVPILGINVGMFYRKDFFENAGVTVPFKNWDEFFAAGDKLKEQGITLFSGQTLGTAWTPMLMYSTIVGGIEGPDYVKNITDFSAPGWLEGAKILERLKDYTTEDAVGGDYQVAANNFLQGKTATIANGPWMIADFTTAGIYDQVGVMPMPGEVLILGPVGTLATSIQNESDPERMAAIIKFMKYFNSPETLKRLSIESGQVFAGTFELSEAEVDPLIAELTNFNTEYQTVNQARDALPATFGTALEEELSSLWQGRVTAEQFIQNLSDKTFK